MTDCPEPRGARCEALRMRVVLLYCLAVSCLAAAAGCVCRRQVAGLARCIRLPMDSVRPDPGLQSLTAPVLTDIDIAPDGSRCVVRLASPNTNDICVLDTTTGGMVGTYESDCAWMGRQQFRGSAKEVLCISDAQELWLLDVEEGAFERVLEEGTGARAFAVSPDGRRVAVCPTKYDGGEQLDVKKHERLGSVIWVPSFAATVSFSSDGEVLAASRGHWAYVWIVADGAMPQKLKFARRIQKAIPISKKNWVVVGSGGEIGDQPALLEVWDYAARKRIRSLATDGYDIVDMVVSPDGSTLYVLGADGVLDVWDISSGTRCQTLEALSTRGVAWMHFRLLALSADGSVLASRPNEETVHIWRLLPWQEESGVFFAGKKRSQESFP